jgi:ABC-type bacteriocin/lantibiotic exporter with double-glycine peptidase domain
MIFAFLGTQISEQELFQEVILETGGLNPEELSQLGRRHGLRAIERQLTLEELVDLTSQNRFPIVFLNRGPVDKADEGHAVIPVRFSRHFVTILDPLQSKRRISIRKFEAARRLVNYWSVVWESMTETGI